MDIRRKKPKIIDLRKKRGKVVPVRTPVKVHIDEPIAQPPRTTSQVECVQCGGGNEDMLRCGNCEAKHQQTINTLSKPVPKVERPRVKLYGFKSIKQGIECTDWYSEEDLITLRMPIPQNAEIKYE